MTQAEDGDGQLWTYLVACVRDELRDGALEYDDAIEDLVALGFAPGEARDLLSPISRRRPKVARPV